MTIELQLCIMNYELNFGRSASRRAFRYIFARLISVSLPQIPFPNPISRFPFPNPETLAKDAAPIPNALAAIKNWKWNFENWKSVSV